MVFIVYWFYLADYEPTWVSIPDDSRQAYWTHGWQGWRFERTFWIRNWWEKRAWPIYLIFEQYLLRISQDVSVAKPRRDSTDFAKQAIKLHPEYKFLQYRAAFNWNNVRRYKPFFDTPCTTCFSIQTPFSSPAIRATKKDDIQMG